MSNWWRWAAVTRNCSNCKPPDIVDRHVLRPRRLPPGSRPDRVCRLGRIPDQPGNRQPLAGDDAVCPHYSITN